MSEERFKRRLDRANNARKEAERLLEAKSLELWTLNQKLEQIVDQRTKALETTLEELELAMIAKDDFLSNMSHEIRTPLNAIIGFVDILKRSSYNKDRFDKYLNIIGHSGKNLLQIINDILDFSKIKSGKFTIEKINVEIKQHLQNTFELFESKALEKNIQYKIEFSESFPQHATLDMTRVTQVISNLISNAIKFTPNNGSVTTKAIFDYSINNLTVSIQDTGIGIAKEHIGKVFNTFEQEDTSTTRKFGGTGLGLAISKSLVELMGGTITVESEKDKGSVFTFSIPIEIKDTQQTKIIQDDNQNTPNNFIGKLLVAEDNPTNQLLIETLLEDLNVQYDLVNNGKEALEAVNKENYKLVLMDNQMPVMSGIEATVEIRKNTKTLPIIALSANVLTQDKVKFQEAGMNGSLSKPINLDELITVLVQYMK